MLLTADLDTGYPTDTSNTMCPVLCIIVTPHTHHLCAPFSAPHPLITPSPSIYGAVAMCQALSKHQGHSHEQNCKVFPLMASLYH